MEHGLASAQSTAFAKVSEGNTRSGELNQAASTSFLLTASSQSSFIGGTLLTFIA
jgi:hypothetical protein